MTVSLIVPTYNGEAFLQKALDSIPKRDDIEVIIVNDGSTDRTKEIAENWIQTRSNAKLINLPENKGLGNAKNVGYDNATGDYINQLDCDDYLLPQYERVLTELDGSDIVFMNLRRNDNTILYFNNQTYRNMGSGCARFIKKEFLGDTRCPETRWAEDWYLSEELEKKPHNYKFTNIVGYHYNYPRKRKLMRPSYTWYV